MVVPVNLIPDALAQAARTLGLIERSRDPSDERQVRARLTKAGRALRAKALPIAVCIDGATGLKPADIRRLQTEIRILRNRLESYDGK